MGANIDKNDTIHITHVMLNTKKGEFLDINQSTYPIRVGEITIKCTAY